VDPSHYTEPDPAELAERAVFLLREVFGYDYGAIAGTTGKTEAACRQIFVRARRRIDEGRPRFETSRAEGEELTGLFLAADADGDLIAVIAFDVLDGQVQAIRAVANPDKLRHLGPVSRTWHLRWRKNKNTRECHSPGGSGVVEGRREDSGGR